MNDHNYESLEPAADSVTPSTGADRIAQRWIHRAAEAAPPQICERLREEWMNDLAERPCEWARLRFAIGCYWAAHVITRENATLVLAGAGTKAMSVVPTDHGFLAGRTGALLCVLLLHGVLAYALLSGLGVRIYHALPKGIVINFLPAATRPTNDFTPAEMKLPRMGLPLQVPNPETPSVSMDGAETLQESTAPVREVVPASPPAQHALLHVTGGPGRAFPNADDFYPPAAKRLEEQGVSQIRVCVDPAGRLTAEPTIAQSSGSVRLDDGALKLAKAGSGNYRAETEDGKAINSCFAFRIRFQLRH